MKKINMHKIILVLIPVLFIFSGISKADTFQYNFPVNPDGYQNQNSYIVSLNSTLNIYPTLILNGTNTGSTGYIGGQMNGYAGSYDLMICGQSYQCFNNANDSGYNNIKVDITPTSQSLVGTDSTTVSAPIQAYANGGVLHPNLAFTGYSSPTITYNPNGLIPNVKSQSYILSTQYLVAISSPANANQWPSFNVNFYITPVSQSFTIKPASTSTSCSTATTTVTTDILKSIDYYHLSCNPSGGSSTGVVIIPFSPAGSTTGGSMSQYYMGDTYKNGKITSITCNPSGGFVSDYSNQCGVGITCSTGAANISYTSTTTTTSNSCGGPKIFVK